MPDINIIVRGKIAYAEDAPQIVCGNSDYTVNFDLDPEWSEEQNLTACFTYIKDGLPVYEESAIEDGACSMPAVFGTDEVLIGVYGESIRTSTPAAVPGMRCITDLPGKHADRQHDTYNELMQRLADIIVPETERGTHRVLSTYTHTGLSTYSHSQLRTINSNL